MDLAILLAASLAGSIVAVLLAAILLAQGARGLGAALPRLVSFSTGTLLGAALLGMVPHAAAGLPAPALARWLLGGLIGFFLLEKLLVWRHCHREECPVHAASGPLLLIGDAVHNFVDGIVLAGAFASSTALGVATAVSTVAHEVPQELGEFAVYLRAGYTPRRALFLNLLTSLTTFLGALCGYAFLGAIGDAGPYLLTVAAAGFLYVALADLVPAQRAPATLAVTVLDVALTATGIGVIAALARH